MPDYNFSQKPDFLILEDMAITLNIAIDLQRYKRIQSGNSGFTAFHLEELVDYIMEFINEKSKHPFIKRIVERTGSERSNIKRFLINALNFSISQENMCMINVENEEGYIMSQYYSVPLHILEPKVNKL